MKQNSFILILIFLSLSAIAQRPIQPKATTPKTVTFQKRIVDTVKNTDFSLNGQYRFMLARSRSSYGAKLINPAKLNSLWQSVTDTIRKERAELIKDRAKIIEPQQTIVNLQAEGSGKENSLHDSNAKLNEINFLGISFTKGNYQLMVWSIISILALALALVIARSAKSIMEAKYRTQLYDEISLEYQAYKTKSNEQQRKLARELQDERNVIEEMKGRS